MGEPEVGGAFGLVREGTRRIYMLGEGDLGSMGHGDGSSWGGGGRELGCQLGV